MKPWISRVTSRFGIGLAGPRSFGHGENNFAGTKATRLVEQAGTLTAPCTAQRIIASLFLCDRRLAKRSHLPFKHAFAYQFRGGPLPPLLVRLFHDFFEREKS